jgi:hypothetical protein
VRLCETEIRNGIRRETTFRKPAGWPELIAISDVQRTGIAGSVRQFDPKTAFLRKSSNDDHAENVLDPTTRRFGVIISS